MQPDRLTRIRHHLYRHGLTGVNDLAKLVDTSVVTMRRDLQKLEELGYIRRTHGGAEIAHAGALEIGFEARETQGLAVKRAIADAAYAALRPHCAIFLDSGTTVLQLALRLSLDPLPLSVFTNSIAIVQALMNTPSIQLSQIAGRVRAENRSVVGPLAERAIEGLWFDQLFLGTSAVQDDASLATQDCEEASMNAAMIRHAGERHLLIDSSKFGRHATYRVAALSELTHVITDEGIIEPWYERLERAGLHRTIVTGHAPAPTLP
ncbi:DeoR/GlpR family DNA-binding transcription regulator [Swaminathania salitolerans]|uniref:Cro/Cl family transcriptional regulator n=1 Tax=Swaminathania salitolerans TaxID=182838 RepID=A0A511BSQ3_9PROT|nr:DeoR/GlpR family DNA-binding transcription regulator [Swaminathania salitolerans]GBQ12449.1 DeoR family transcriptional regulator [Swaminathania salitolerans LMG 21291]GEL02853.1 Cro/Cl family transcriptional regulator [Swaminathania salitolerans]